MILSMTGYGKATEIFQDKTVSVEIKSLNSKGLDLYMKMPSVYREKELSLRQVIGEQLVRGKIDVSISIENVGSSKQTSINKQLAAVYLEELRALDTLVGAPAKDYHSLLLRMPDIYVQETEFLSDEETEFLEQLCRKACEQLLIFRKQEGKALEQEFEQQIGHIRRLLLSVEPFEQQRITLLKERLYKHLDEQLKQQVDENRFTQELIFYLEKLDISEEKMRLANHLDYFLETMQSDDSGKKLGFITQEIGREVNTLGSKANQLDIQKMVVEMKDALEKIKEQVLNTL